MARYYFNRFNYLKNLRQLAFAFFILLFQPRLTFAQSSKGAEREINIELKKVTGFGPDGQFSRVIPSNDKIIEEERAAYPAMKEIPTQLTRIKEYYFLFDEFQFYYQNYKQGTFSKNYFIQKAERDGWDLNDTVQLSPKPIHCGVGVVAGYNDKNELVYLIDANNNNDFSDELIRPVFKGSGFIASKVEDAAVKVRVEYSENKKMEEEQSLVLVTESYSSKPGEVALSFSFPEFSYGKFDFEGQTYILCTANAAFKNPAIVVLPDRPYFTSIPRGNRIKYGKYVNLNGHLFTYAQYDKYDQKITLEGNEISKIIPRKENSEQRKDTGDLSTMVSDQIGFTAPLIKGIDINNGLLLSSESLKGKYVFVDFWSTACGPCIADFPNLKKVYDKYNRSGFEMVSMADERLNGRVAELLKEYQLSWPTILTNKKETVMKGYKIYSYPTSYLINPEGKIINVNLREEDLMLVLNNLIKK